MQYRKLERPHYFAGQLLGAEDLQREQDYHRNRSRLHNRFLHGWGVVAGLRVSLDQGTVVVSPGIALDCAGNELVLACEERLALPGVAGRRYVALRYVELPVGQVVSANHSAEPSHVEEGAVVELLPGNPQAGHRIGSPGCGADHALCLAVVSRRGSRWRVVKVRGSVS